jgi:hypothetical protein
MVEQGRGEQPVPEARDEIGFCERRYDLRSADEATLPKRRAGTALPEHPIASSHLLGAPSRQSDRSDLRICEPPFVIGTQDQGYSHVAIQLFINR